MNKSQELEEEDTVLPVNRAKWRNDLYIIIFEADTRAGQLFDIALLVAILLTILVISLETVEGIGSGENARWSRALYAMEWLLTILFTIEYVARVVCAPRPLRYVFSLFGVIDLLACLPLYITHFTNLKSNSLVIIRSIRLLRVFRVLKMMRMLKEAHELRDAIWGSRDKILVFIAVVLVAVTISSTLMYQVEKDAPDSHFTSIPQAMYWAVVTMTTVGYGDIVPHTVVGKFISAALILLGYSLIIVPTGFVSTEIHQSSLKRLASNRVCPECHREAVAVESLFCDMCGTHLVHAKSQQ